MTNKDTRKNIRLTLREKQDINIINILDNVTDKQQFIKEAIYSYYTDILRNQKASMYLNIDLNNNLNNQEEQEPQGQEPQQEQQEQKEQEQNQNKKISSDLNASLNIFTHTNKDILINEDDYNETENYNNDDDDFF